jgi:catechol 2,3-dioxygenase-like lactoylglutathione lyase family enzyme
LTAKLKTINVVVLFVSDLERAKSFYGDVLGMPLTFDDGSSAGFDFDPVLLILLTASEAGKLLTNDSVAAPESAGTKSQLVSFVDDVDAIYADLSAKGVEFVREPVDREWGLRTAHFRDPDGNIWELAQRISTD